MGAMVASVALCKGDKARLKIDNLKTPVVTRVDARTDERMTVKQALPFLKLDTGVSDEEGRRAVIRSVKVAVEEGTPSLVIELAYDDTEGPSDPSMGLDDTLPAPLRIVPRGHYKPRRDQTIPFGFPKRRDHADRPLTPLRKSANPEDLMKCYLLTRRKDSKIVVEPELTDQIHREQTRLFPEGSREAASAPPVARNDRDRQQSEPKGAKPTFAKRARAFAAAFWASMADTRTQPK